MRVPRGTLGSPRKERARRHRVREREVRCGEHGAEREADGAGCEKRGATHDAKDDRRTVWGYAMRSAVDHYPMRARTHAQIIHAQVIDLPAAEEYVRRTRTPLSTHPCTRAVYGERVHHSCDGASI